MYSQALNRAENHNALNAKTDEDDRSRAMSMVTDFQRQVLGVSHTESTGLTGKGDKK
jgi:hypothetical protein